MGQRGPPPKPPEQKRLEGTYTDRDAEREAAAAPSAGAPPMPATLSPEARAVWEWVVPELLRLKTLSIVDGGVLVAYCRTLARAEKLDALADAEPLVDGGMYGLKVNPAGAEARKLWPIVEKLATDLGLHYAARARVAMPKIDDATDPVESDLFGTLTALPGGKAGT